MSAYVSAFELFSIGVGPSSSHTVGPMRAALDFVARLREAGLLDRVGRVTCTLYGSLGATGIGHGTPDAVVAGLMGLEPETVDPDAVRTAWGGWRAGSDLPLAGTHPVAFSKGDIAFEPRTRLPGHPNAMTLEAWTGPDGGRPPRIGADAEAAAVRETGSRFALDSREAAALANADDGLVLRETYYSVGGGFIRRDGEAPRVRARGFPLDYSSAEELLALCDERGLTIAELARINEEALRDDEGIATGLDAIWDAMAGCVEAGLHADGELPGMLKVKRRAGAIRAQLDEAEADGRRELPGEWLGAFALAVNEENASGGRVVTAPTNGAAGIVPAVAMYWWRFLADSGLGAGNAVTPYGELVGSALLGFAAPSVVERGSAATETEDVSSRFARSTTDAEDVSSRFARSTTGAEDVSSRFDAPSVVERGSAATETKRPDAEDVPSRSTTGAEDVPSRFDALSVVERGSAATETKRPDGDDASSRSTTDVAEANRRRGIRRYLLTATALGSLFKANASISGAEGGCQAEVGSACAMAAGGLTAVMGGTNRQIENAAEIAMEHHLGLTCDPVGGLVQIPCIERNAIAASTAVTAARLALRGDGSHYVSLDTVVETMRQTGIDMSHKYKETSEGGLAVNVIEC